jgi:hypothetical protein
MAVVAAARSAALSKILFIYIAIEIFIRYLSQKSSFFLYDKWGTSDRIAGNGGAKGVRRFLLFYL